MKKILTLIFALMLCFNVKAQTPLTEAVDFSSVALNGEEINLFEILDGGQYVLIEFFYSSSSGAVTYVNKMVESYQYFGCNEHEVYFMEVSRYDDEDAARAWCNEYGIMFPTIHTESEGVTGDQICEMYGIPSYPTVILIAPDRQIVLHDIWPVLYTDDIINALTPFGIESHECSLALPEVEMEVNEVTSSVVNIEFTPNLVCESFYTMIGEGDSLEEQGMPIEEVLQEQGVELSGKCNYTWADLKPETTYNIYVLPRSLQDDFGEIGMMTITTTKVPGLSIIELINDQFEVSPNPASSAVNITSVITGGAEVNIFDMSGHCVKKTFVNDLNDATINIEDLSKGVYLININDVVEKLIIE